MSELTKEEYIKKYLSGWGVDAAEREYARIMAGDRFEECPLAAAGFKLVRFVELPTVIIGPDGKCICMKEGYCRNPDRRDGNRCTLEELRQLNSEAMSRRSRQSGEYD